jgi:hypothetical protein
VGDGDEEQYGEIIRHPSEEGIRLAELSTEGHPRVSSSAFSLSPILSSDSAAPTNGHDFPFNPIHRRTATHCPAVLPSPKARGNSWLRGDSINMSTGGSTNPPLSWSGTTGASSSVDSRGMAKAATSHLTLPSPTYLRLIPYFAISFRLRRRRSSN